MNHFNLLALVALTFGLAGCPGGGESDTKGDDTNNPSGFDANATWSGDGVVISISNGTDSSGYDLGMAQTGSDEGWAGEDCLGEIPAAFDYMIDGGYQYCHHINQTGGTLSTVMTIEEVVEGSTTLFSQGLEATITYVLFECSSNVCYSWGDDVGYYDGKGCSSL